MESQLDVRAGILNRSLAEKFIHIKSLLVFEYKINRSADFVGEDAQGFALVVFSFELCHILFGFFGLPEHEDCRFITSPLEMMVADFAV